MKKINAILGKEWMNFKGSERGVFAIYGILVFFWSFFPLNRDLGAGPIWWLFFSVIISGNFSNSVFVSERLSGSMEILLTSGFSRKSVLFGKIAFVLCMSVVIGVLCFSMSIVWLSVSGRGGFLSAPEVLYGIGLYCCGAFMNATCGAWLSVRLQSPRIIPFMTIFIMAAMVGCFYLLSYVFGTHLWMLSIVFIAFAVLFLLLAKKDFDGEKVIQPLHL
jgi:ABC-type Na+ efflux pump permease subunit